MKRLSLFVSAVLAFTILGVFPLQAQDARLLLVKAAKRGDAKTVEQLLDRARVHRHSRTVTRALVEAAGEGHTEIAKRLVAYGGDINARDRYGRTALIRAIETGHAETAQMLIDNGADVNALVERGIGDMEIVKNLTANAAPPRAASKVAEGKVAEDAGELLVDAAKRGDAKTVARVLDGGLVKLRRRTATRALVGAAENGHTEIAKMLIDNGADVNADIKPINAYGITPLMHAAIFGHTEMGKLLIDNGANVNAVSKSGITALMVAAANGHTEIAKMLIDNGANINAKTEDGWDALRCATENGHTEIVELIKQAEEKAKIEELIKEVKEKTKDSFRDKIKSKWNLFRWNK